MFGKNPIRSKLSDPNSLAVEAMFYTLQGEGPYAGMPALFIRLAGCNLACHFCDTQFEQNADRPIDLQRIVEDLQSDFSKQARRFVVITGGEPLRQDFSGLAAWLLANGTELIQVETAGTIWQPSIEQMVMHEQIVLVCSPKTPKVNQAVSAYCLHWKYVIKAGETDHAGLPFFSTQILGLAGPGLYRPDPDHVDDAGMTIWLSPCDEYDPVKNKANQDAARDLCLQHGYRLSLQTHKIVNVE